MLKRARISSIKRMPSKQRWHDSMRLSYDSPRWSSSKKAKRQIKAQLLFYRISFGLVSSDGRVITALSPPMLRENEDLIMIKIESQLKSSMNDWCKHLIIHITQSS